MHRTSKKLSWLLVSGDNDDDDNVVCIVLATISVNETISTLGH